MSTPAPKKKAAAGSEPEPVPGVDVGDHLYVTHAGAPATGLVLAHGKHGVSVRIAGKTHPILWEHVLGHKRRAMQRYSIVDEGEDGMIVQDGGGRRKYIATPNESKDDPMVAKAQRPVLLFKSMPGGGVPRPGLTQKKITDKNGVNTTKWVKVDRGGPPAQKGQHVGFENGEHRGHGQVMAAGQHGVVARDDKGGEHRVAHEKITHHWGGDGAPDHSPHEDQQQPLERPNYEPRLDGEDDKKYAKRVVDKGEAPSHLPEEHGKYFHTEGSTHVGLDNLHSTKSDEENQQGGDNGPKRMQAAYHGVLGKRDPIKVMPHAEKEGHFEVVDGNGTLTSAKKLGWKGLPTQVLSREDGLAHQAAEKAKDAAKAAKEPLFKPGEYDHLEKKQPQQWSTWEDLSAQAPEGLAEFTKMLDSIGKSMNLVKGSNPDKVTKAEWENDKGYLFIGPIKTHERAELKVSTDYDGDWSQLSDMVRATISVPDMGGVRQVLDHLKSVGLQFAQKPKDNFAKPTSEGYRDLNTIVRLPNGLLAELQIHVKAITLAKKAGHKDYALQGKLRGKYHEKEPTDRWSDKDARKFYEARKRQQELYGAAFDKVINGGATPESAPAAKPAAGEEPVSKALPPRRTIVVFRRPA